jgi:hypothetical protein
MLRIRALFCRHRAAKARNFLLAAQKASMATRGEERREEWEEDGGRGEARRAAPAVGDVDGACVAARTDRL